MKRWSTTFHTRRLELLKKFETEVDELIASFLGPLLASASDVHPAVHSAVESLRDSILNEGTKLKQAAKELFDDVNEAAKGAHRAVKPQVKSAWQDVYTACAAARGTNHFARNKKAHKDHVNGDGGVPMFKKAGVAMKSILNQSLKKLPAKFEASYQKAETTIRRHLITTLDRYTIGVGNANDGLSAKENLEKALQPISDELKKAWGMEPSSEVVEDAARVDLDGGDTENDAFHFDANEYE